MKSLKRTIGGGLVRRPVVDLVLIECESLNPVSCNERAYLCLAQVPGGMFGQAFPWYASTSAELYMDVQTGRHFVAQGQCENDLNGFSEVRPDRG